LPFTIAWDKPTWLHAIFAIAFLFASAPNVALLAQGLDAEGAIDTIVGSDVKTGELKAATDEGRILAAIEKSTENAADVRKRFSIDDVEIVFLPDVGEDTAVEAKLEEFKDGVAALREAIQGSAIFYHAIDSRSVLLTDVVAVEFNDQNGVAIFVAGDEP
jgi:hypothetical protein